jgi:hypothetical protein
MLEAEQPSRRFRRVAVDPVEIGGGEFVMRLDGAPMFRRAGELDLRLGPAFVIFAFFLRHLAGISALFRNRIKTVKPPPPFPEIALIQVVDPGYVHRTLKPQRAKPAKAAGNGGKG